MSRKARTGQRKVTVDPKFKSELASKFINKLMYDGKKSIAQNIFYKALKIVAQHFEGHESVQGATREAKEIKIGPAMLKKAIDNVSPPVEVRSRRVGGATYQVPVEVPPYRRMALAIRWIIDAARKRKEQGMIKRLAAEIIDAVNKKGGAWAKLESVLKSAEANRAFAHYRW